MKRKLMTLVTYDDLQQLRSSHKDDNGDDLGSTSLTSISNVIVHERGPQKFKLERTNVWSFPERGSWATHRGDYRGNWSPYAPRNLILRYTREGDTVLDQMMGSGTTLVECKLLRRNAIGVDINRQAVLLALRRLDFACKGRKAEERILTYEGDARYLNRIGAGTVDLIATHPPYAGVIRYSPSGAATEGDLSRFQEVGAYLHEMRRVADECYRVLKPGRNCCIMVGDTRRRRHHVPLAFRVMQVFLDSGFVLCEDIVKLQWNTQSERRRWNADRYPFLLLAYEHLFVFQKLATEEERNQLIESGKWW